MFTGNINIQEKRKYVKNMTNYCKEMCNESYVTTFILNAYIAQAFGKVIHSFSHSFISSFHFLPFINQVIHSSSPPVHLETHFKHSASPNGLMTHPSVCPLKATGSIHRVTVISAAHSLSCPSPFTSENYFPTLLFALQLLFTFSLSSMLH